MMRPITGVFYKAGSYIKRRFTDSKGKEKLVHISKKLKTKISSIKLGRNRAVVEEQIQLDKIAIFKGYCSKRCQFIEDPDIGHDKQLQVGYQNRMHENQSGQFKIDPHANIMALEYIRSKKRRKFCDAVKAKWIDVQNRLITKVQYAT